VWGDHSLRREGRPVKRTADLTSEQQDEERNVRELRLRVDLVCSLLLQESVSLHEALRYWSAVRHFALERFPEKEATFDLIYGARFRRVLLERFPLG